jgi:hypothetical protein
MKINLLLGALLLTRLGSPAFASECQVYDARCNAACEPRIQLGFDGDDNVLAPAAKPPAPAKDKGGSNVVMAAAAVMLASRALKSR